MLRYSPSLQELYTLQTYIMQDKNDRRNIHRSPHINVSLCIKKNLQNFQFYAILCCQKAFTRIRKFEESLFYFEPQENFTIKLARLPPFPFWTTLKKLQYCGQASLIEKNEIQKNSKENLIRQAGKTDYTSGCFWWPLGSLNFNWTKSLAADIDNLTVESIALGHSL